MIEARDLSGPLCAIPSFAAHDYQTHPLHGESQNWVEKNCYIDIWIEVLHALGCQPLAALGFTAALDFEGDSWTFFKPPHEDLHELFAVDVQEMNIWRPLVDHVAEHLSNGKLVSTEADSFWLPDTGGTDYRTNHVKTTIVIVEFDFQNQRLGYFHNAGYFQLTGEDFTQLFAREGREILPLFAELIRFENIKNHSESQLKSIARRLLKKHMARRPVINPVDNFKARFEGDLSWLQNKGLETYHVWAFANFRQLGAAMELLARHIEWLEIDEEVIADFDQISQTAKACILKGARAVSTGKPMDTALFDVMSEAWQRGMNSLDKALRQ